jgi:enoyl-CoA hydratase/carnithine racemase
VLRADGPAFSAGLDRTRMPALLDLGHAPDALEQMERFQQGVAWLGRADLVSIAAVQGHAIGAGMQLALACDLRVVADNAVFALPETRIGIVPILGGTHPLVAAVGLPRALEWCLTGREVGAAEALAAGLVNAVVPTHQLAERTDALAAAVLAAPRDAVIETKALLRGASERSPQEQWKAEREAQQRILRALTT